MDYEESGIRRTRTQTINAMTGLELGLDDVSRLTNAGMCGFVGVKRDTCTIASGCSDGRDGKSVTIDFDRST